VKLKNISGRSYLTTRMRALMALTSLTLLSPVAHAHGEPVAIYRETFGFCTESLGLAAATQTKWTAMNAGTVTAKIGNLKVYPYGSFSIGGSVNSNPLGLSQGYSFWWKPVYGLSITTAEFPFDAAVLADHDTLVEYEQRLSGVDAQLKPNATHIAFRIDGKWYISDTSVAQEKFGRWQLVSISPSVLKYGVVPAVDRVGPVIPISFDETLPAAGTVEAFGVFIVEVNGRVRIDNFTIKTGLASAQKFSVPVQQPNVTLCPASSPDTNGSSAPPTPAPTPGGGDGGSGGLDDSAGGEPGGTDNGNDGTIGGNDQSEHQTPVDAPTFAMCTGQQSGYGKTVAISAAQRAQIVRKIAGTSQLSLRDRAFISVLSTRRMPIGAVVNARLSDVNLTKRTLTVTLKPGGTQRTLRLTRLTAKRLNDYIAAMSGAHLPVAPLFVKGSAKTGKLMIDRAACVSDLTRIIFKRAASAAIPFKALLAKQTSK
jgi:hypothetical protein